MTFLATNKLPSDEYPRAKKQAAQFKTYCQNVRTLFVAGTEADTVIALYFDSIRFRNIMNTAAAVPGIAAYAQAQEDDVGYDVAAEFTAMINAVDAVVAEIESLYPVDGSGYLLDRQLSGGTIVYRNFTAGQLASTVTLLDVVIGLIG